MQGHALLEIMQVGIQKSRDVLRCHRETRLLEHLPRDQAIRGSREIDPIQVLRNAKGILHGVLEGLLPCSPEVIRVPSMSKSRRRTLIVVVAILGLVGQRLSTSTSPAC